MTDQPERIGGPESGAQARDRLDRVGQGAHRTAEEVEELVARLAERKPEKDEAAELARLILHKLAHSVEGEAHAVIDELEVKRSFLQHRFEDAARAYARGDRFYGGLDTFLNVGSIFAGAATSVAASLGAAKAVPIVLGLVVLLQQGISQWLKPAQRAARLDRAGQDLLQEAWDFVQDHGRYRGREVDASWGIFCDQVSKVERDQAAAEDQDATQSGLASRVQQAAGHLPGGK